MIRVCTVLVVLSVAGRAIAQTAPAKRPRVPPQTMTLTLALAGAGAGDSEDVAPEAAALTGVHTDGDAMLVYQRHLRRGTVGASVRSVTRYDRAARAITPMRERGSVELSIGDSRRYLRASQSASYSPFYQFGSVPDAEQSPLADTAIAHGDFANSRTSAYATTTDIEAAQPIGRRTAVGLSYNLRRTTFDHQAQDLTSQNGVVRLTHRLTRRLSARTGYGFRTATYTAGGAAVRVHDLDLGVDYSRALSLSRRTTLAFSSGSTVVDEGSQHRFVVTGDATLARAIGRTWTARLAIKRDVNLLEGFAAPLLTNAITTTVGGGLTRRFSVAGAIAVASGTVGIANATAQRYANWTASGGLRAALNRRASFDAQYFRYGHDFDERVRLVSGVANRQRRQGVRVGLTWQLSIME